MSTITVEIWSSISHLFGEERPPESGRKLYLQESLPEDGTLFDLLRQLAADNPRFGRMMFDPKTGNPTDLVQIVVNDRLPELLQGYDTVLKDGDRVTLVQAYAGG